MSLNNTSEDISGDIERKGAENVSPTISSVQPVQTRKHARLSTVFRRDVLSPMGPENDNLPSSSPLSHQGSDFRSSDSTSNKCSPDLQHESRISLSDYEKALQTEKEEWSLTRRARSEKYHQLHAQLKSQAFDTITMESCAHLLTDADKKVMSERPKYVRIANKARDMKEEIIIAMGIKNSKLLAAKTTVAKFTKTLEVFDREIANLD